MREHFPPMPEYVAEYMPIFYEPILASGERIVVAIAAVADNGDTRVHKTINPERIDAMFDGNKGPRELIDTAVDCFAKALELTTDSNWPPPNSYPFSGFTDGPIKRAASDDMKGVINQGIQMHCAFGTLITNEQ